MSDTAGQNDRGTVKMDVQNEKGSDAAYVMFVDGEGNARYRKVPDADLETMKAYAAGSSLPTRGIDPGVEVQVHQIIEFINCCSVYNPRDKRTICSISRRVRRILIT